MAITKIGTPELFDFSATNTALQLPTGPTSGTGGRPSNPSTGEWRFNTTEKYVEFWDGGAWRQIDTEALPSDIVDIDNFDITNKTVFNPSEVAQYSGGGCSFIDSGTKFLAGSEYIPSGIIYQYNLSTAFDLTTATYANISKDLDGLYLYMTYMPTDTYLFTDEYFAAGDNRILRYDLSSANNVSTASFVTGQRIDNNTMSAKVTNFTMASGGISFNSDGTRLYVAFTNSINTTGGKIVIQRYDLSTAYDISGVNAATANSTSPELTTNAGGLRGQISVSADEKQILVMNLTPNGTLSQIDLTTATDLTTASLTKTRTFGGGNLIGFRYYMTPKIATSASDGSGEYYAYDYV